MTDSFIHSKKIGSRIIIWALEKRGRTVSNPKQHNSEDDEKCDTSEGVIYAFEKKGLKRKRAIELHLTKPSYIQVFVC